MLLFLGNLVWDNASSKFEVNLNPGLDGEDIKWIEAEDNITNSKPRHQNCQLFKYLTRTFDGQFELDGWEDGLLLG